MKIGLIGLQNSGKTTIFNALTRSAADVAAYSSQKVEPNLAMVEVEDERVKQLSAMYNPKKTIFATVDFIDFVGLAAGAAKEGVLSGQAMSLLKTVHALALVVRNFEDELISGVLGKPDPLADATSLNEELILSDLIVAEKRLERLDADFKKGKKSAETQGEQKTLQKVKESLDNNLPLREVDFSEDELKILHGFQFLSLKPLMVILNSAESNYGKNNTLFQQLQHSFRAIEFAGEFEMELSRLEDKEEALIFMEDLGIAESARDRLIALAYDLLGYISFFTVGEDEVRAWTIIRGTPAVEAAGVIHSDLQRGFIRAECFSYQALSELGSEKAIKEKGQFRLEGKNYIVQDGDILNIRFSV